jgi:hypothetical protein
MEVGNVRLSTASQQPTICAVAVRRKTSSIHEAGIKAMLLITVPLKSTYAIS